MSTDLRTSMREGVDLLLSDADPSIRAIGEALRATATSDLDFEERTWVWLIEDLRSEVYSSSVEVSTALLNRSSDKRAPLGEVARQRSKKHPWTTFLMLLVRRLSPTRVLELGTAVGISASYLGAGLRMNGHGRLLTIEGSPGLAEVARGHLAELGLDGVEVEDGMFQQVLGTCVDRFAPLDLVFVDGHHDEDATKVYFEQLIPGLAPDAVVVFDDITWSDGMRRAWSVLQDHPAVTLAVDLDQIGICVVNESTAGQHRANHVLHLPRVKESAIDVDSMPTAPVGDRRLRWSVEGRFEPGWIVIDDEERPGVHLVATPQHGLPLADGSVAYAAAIHVLQGLALADVVPALTELCRVLVPGGVLRVAVPGLEEMLEHWRRGDVHQFIVPDHQAASASGKLIVDLLWYGHNRSLFTAEFLDELLRSAGFTEVRQCEPGATSSPYEAIVDVDERPAVSLVLEAIR